MTTCRCPEGCGRPVHANGYSSACNRRWIAANRPADGPPPPKRRGGMTVAGHAAMTASDIYDLDWKDRRQERRIARSVPWRQAAVACIRNGDAHGVRVVWENADLPALFVAMGARIAELEDALTRPGERARRDERSAA